MKQAPPYPAETYYRISVKALVFDDQQRLLVFRDANGEWEIPGGGMEHGEDYLACLRRELAEEAGVQVRTVGDLAFPYRCSSQHGHPKIALAFVVELASTDFSFGDDDVVAAQFVTKQEFTRMPFQQGEAPVQQYADQIWQLVEKSSKNG